MCVELDRDIYSTLECLYKSFCFIRSKQSRHILDADRICTCFFYSLCIVDVILFCKYFTECVRDSYLSVCALLLCSLNGCFEVSYIVERIENSDYINTVCYRLLNEIFQYIVSIVTVTEHILSSEKHL